MKATSDAYFHDKKNKPLEKSKEIAVEVVPLGKLQKPVTLTRIKSSRKFKDFYLLKIPRLSVMQVTEDQWKTIISLSGLD